MKLVNNTKLAGSVLAMLACASFLSCSRHSDDVALRDSAVTESTGSAPAGNAVGAPVASVATTDAANTTVSNTTIAADDTPKTLDTTGTVPPSAADESAGSATTDKSLAPTTKKTKHMKKTKKTKKSASALAPSEPVVSNTTEDDSYFYDSDLATTDSGMLDPSQGIGSVDASQDFDDTVSATTSSAGAYMREDGLSPFFHEPDSRMPIQIGSGQLTGEDKSTTILEGPSLFQDPSALGRDLVH